MSHSLSYVHVTKENLFFLYLFLLYFFLSFKIPRPMGNCVFNMYLLLGCCFMSCLPVVKHKMGLKRHLVVEFVPPGFGKIPSCLFSVLLLLFF